MNREYRAAQEAQALKQQGIEREQAIQQAAEKENVYTSNVSNLMASSTAFEKKPQNYTSNVSESQKAYFVTEEGKPTYRADSSKPINAAEISKSEYNIRREYARTREPVKVMYEGEEAEATITKSGELKIQRAGFTRVFGKPEPKKPETPEQKVAKLAVAESYITASEGFKKLAEQRRIEEQTKLGLKNLEPIEVSYSTAGGIAQIKGIVELPELKEPEYEVMKPLEKEEITPPPTIPKGFITKTMGQQETMSIPIDERYVLGNLPLEYKEAYESDKRLRTRIKESLIVQTAASYLKGGAKLVLGAELSSKIFKKDYQRALESKDLMGMIDKDQAAFLGLSLLGAGGAASPLIAEGIEFTGLGLASKKIGSKAKAYQDLGKSPTDISIRDIEEIALLTLPTTARGLKKLKFEITGRETATVTRLKDNVLSLAEEAELAKGKLTRKLRFEAEKAKLVTKAKIPEFEQRVKAPQEPEQLIDFLMRDDISTGFEITEKGLGIAYYQQRPASIRNYNIKPTPFEIRGKANLVSLEEVKQPSDVILDIGAKRQPSKTYEIDLTKPETVEVIKKKARDIKRSVYPEEYTYTTEKGMTTAEKDLGTFQKAKSSIKKLALVGRTKVTEVFSPIKAKVGNVLGLDLYIPQDVVIKGRVVSGKPITSIDRPLEMTSAFPFSKGAEKKESRIEQPSILIEERDLEPITKTAQKPKVKMEEPQITESWLRQIEITKPKPTAKDKPLIEEPEKPVFNIIPDIDIRIADKPITDLNRTFEEPKPVEEPPKPEPKIPTFDYNRKEDEPKAKGRMFEGYNTFVKDKGKFTKVNKKPLSRQDALSLGARLTDKSTAATFKLKKVKSESPPAFAGDLYFNFNMDKFRQKNKEDDTYIEKRKYRIDTPQEKKQLSLARAMKQMQDNIIGTFGNKRTKPMKWF